MSYKSVYLQSLTLLNTSRATFPVGRDKECSKSWPNSIFASRKEGYAWPRLSLYDLSRPKSELQESVRKSNRTFSLVDIWVKPTGNSTGAPGKTFGVLSITMLRLDPNPNSSPISPDAGYPGIVRGVPLLLPIANLLEVAVYFGAGVSGGFQLPLKLWLGDKFPLHHDVIEVTSRILRQDKSGGFREAEDWEVCMDNIVLEIVEQDASRHIESGAKFVGFKSDGSSISREDKEWEVLQQMAEVESF